MSEIIYKLDNVPTQSQCLCDICCDFLLHSQFENYFLTHSKTSFKQLMLISFSVKGARSPFSGDLPRQIYQDYEYFDALTDMVLIDGLRRGNIKEVVLPSLVS